ncbi:MAG: hypothetical protein QOF76_5282 [Solirubrobacteraceae bacterium]|nr:hypothetical protein [Solirubrobacteraceae bacterium]
MVGGASATQPIENRVNKQHRNACWKKQPRVIANLRLGVSQPDAHKDAAGDPGALSPVQGYGAHYCNIPSRVDPKIVACSFIPDRKA